MDPSSTLTEEEETQFIERQTKTFVPQMIECLKTMPYIEGLNATYDVMEIALPEDGPARPKLAKSLLVHTLE